MPSEPRTTPPTNLQHFNRLLSAFAESDEGMPVARARHALSVVAICAIVDRARRTGDGSHLFVAKGGSSMQLRLGIIARATTDLDLLFRGRAADWLEPFDAALLSGNWNGFEARRKNDPVEIAVEGVTYKPWRFDVSLAYVGRSFSTVRVELALDALSAGHHDEVDGATAQWFGFHPPPIPCLSIPYQMAQKLHACTDPYDGTGQRGNDRVRDIVDLWLLEPILGVDGHREVRAAVIETFDRRAKHSWPPAVVPTDHWQRDYPKLAAEVPGAPPDVEAAVEYLKGLIDRVDQANQ
jgi:hypothetical protein